MTNSGPSQVQTLDEGAGSRLIDLFCEAAGIEFQSDEIRQKLARYREIYLMVHESSGHPERDTKRRQILTAEHNNDDKKSAKRSERIVLLINTLLAELRSLDEDGHFLTSVMDAGKSEHQRWADFFEMAFFLRDRAQMTSVPPRLTANGYAPNSLEGQSRYMAREVMNDPRFRASRGALVAAPREYGNGHTRAHPQLRISRRR